jgi:hypothetical protein
MGDGSDVAREAADMVLLENFEAIVVALEYGTFLPDHYTLLARFSTHIYCEYHAWCPSLSFHGSQLRDFSGLCANFIFSVSQVDLFMTT